MKQTNQKLTLDELKAKATLQTLTKDNQVFLFGASQAICLSDDGSDNESGYPRRHPKCDNV